MTKIIPTPILETKRIVLKPLALEDAEAIQKHFNNWNIIKNLLDTVPWPYPEDGAKDFIQNKAFPRIKSGKAHLWTIRLKEKENDPIGIIEFRADPQARDDHRGFWLAEPYWKNGYMTEAVSAVNDFIFDIAGKEKIIVCNVLGNEGSKRVKEKTGAKLIGIKEMKHHQGKQQTEIWELTAQAWKEFRESQKSDT